MRSLVNIIIFLSLAVLIGAVAFFGIGVAAVVFQPGLLAGKTMAGALNSIVLRRLGIMALSASVLLTGAMLYNALSGKSFAYWSGLILSVAILGINIYISASLFPRMDALRVAIGNFDRVPDEKLPLKQDFDQGHKLYSTLTSVGLMGAVLVLILNTAGLVAAGRSKPVRQTPGAAGHSTRVPTASTPVVSAVKPSAPETVKHPPPPEVDADIPADHTEPAGTDVPVTPLTTTANGTPAEAPTPPESTPVPDTGAPTN